MLNLFSFKEWHNVTFTFIIICKVKWNKNHEPWGREGKKERGMEERKERGREEGEREGGR